MGGGILDLVATGSQDIILIGNPEKTFFKAKYSKYTNFGMQKFRIDYNGLRTLRLSDEAEFKFKIPKYADMLMDTYVVVTLPLIWSPLYPPQNEDEEWRGYEFKWIKDIGCQIIKEITISTGGQLLQKYSGSYIQNMANRDYSNSKRDLFNKMTGNISELNDPGNSHNREGNYPNAFYTEESSGRFPSIDGRKIYIPINTWFTQSSKMAFPLNSLYNNDLFINVKLRSIRELFTIRDVTDVENNYPRVAPNFTNPLMSFYRFLQPPPSAAIDEADYEDKRILWNADVHLYSTYCFLSEDEAQLFKTRDQQYLMKIIYEHEFNNVVGSNKLSLNTTGLVSNWMFTCERSDVNLRNEWSNYTNWPYDYLPNNLINAPQNGSYKYTGYVNSTHVNGIGPGINGDNSNSGLYITDNFNNRNRKDIIQKLGIMFDGQYRESLMDIGIFEYLEPFSKSNGSNSNGLYSYNFSLNSDPSDLQPSGAINFSMFKKIELECNTFTPTLDEDATVLTICDENGTVIGVNKPSWIIYDYTYTMRFYEEKYNIISFQGGNCGLMYAR
jgi:hypothetical protein